jgi:hypothetical protein
MLVTMALAASRIESRLPRLSSIARTWPASRRSEASNDFRKCMMFDAVCLQWQMLPWVFSYILRYACPSYFEREGSRCDQPQDTIKRPKNAQAKPRRSPILAKIDCWCRFSDVWALVASNQTASRTAWYRVLLCSVMLCLPAGTHEDIQWKWRRLLVSKRSIFKGTHLADAKAATYLRRLSFRALA